jgi:hypothetical protein
MKMKKVNLLSFILALTILGCNKSKTLDYIFLNAEQLKPLGIELSEKGIFYKNSNPNWSADNEKYQCLGFYGTSDTYLTTYHFNESDTLKAKNSIDSLLLDREITRNGFYPILIGNTKGEYSLDSENKNIKLLPIAICLEEAGMPERKDTLIIWFKYNEAVEKMLPEGIETENYLRFPDSKE